MKLFLRFIVGFILITGAFLLHACSAPKPTDITQSFLKREISFTGDVEAMLEREWIIAGQPVIVTPVALTDSQITVGDIVQVEGTVMDDGTVVALKIEIVKWMTELPTLAMVVLAFLFLLILLMTRSARQAIA